MVFPPWLGSVQALDSTSMPAYESDENALRMRAIAEGDEKALRALIEQWQRPLLAFFIRATGSYADAEELAQLTFIRLYRAASRYRAEAKFSTYLFHIARKLLLNHLRQRRRKPFETLPPEDLLQFASNPATARDFQEWEEQFQFALSSLPEKQRTALLLLQQQGLSYEEIATAMGASTVAVKSWLYRARQSLRATLHFDKP